jgi:hypothetical protein
MPKGELTLRTLRIAWSVTWGVTCLLLDLDGDVDGGDFLNWQRGQSPNNGSAADLAVWQEHFGEDGSTATSAAVPEPATSALLMFAAVGIRLRRRHHAWWLPRTHWHGRRVNNGQYLGTWPRVAMFLVLRAHVEPTVEPS